MLDLKENEQNTRDELASPDLSPKLGTPVFDQTSISEIRPVNISENAKEDLDNNEDNRPLIWKMKIPIVPPTPIPTKDQVGTTKGKENLTKETLERPRVILQGEQRKSC